MVARCGSSCSSFLVALALLGTAAVVVQATALGGEGVVVASSMAASLDLAENDASRRMLAEDSLKVDRLQLHMVYTGQITFTTRMCRGLDAVQAILEGRVAKLASCEADDVAAVELVCFEGGLNVTLKFNTPTCRISAVDAVSLGLSVLQNIVADPLETQYQLTLVSATPKLANGASFPPPPPPDAGYDNAYSYEYDDSSKYAEYKSPGDTR
ncbi:hypothetical protein FOA52_000739 [Chlamydomonas sp. UWO 241]|nr:hypothetical protein FOA52_000739 [Chlamydomonas sp. UWO 241]